MSQRFKFIVLLFFILPVAFGQYNSISFRRYSVENGISRQWVKRVVQDKKGFIWLGTEEGLNRFDSESFDLIFSLAGTKYSKESINDMIIDVDGNLWIARSNGFAKLNRDDYSFTNYFYEPGKENTIANNLVGALFDDEEGNLWIGQWEGLSKLNKATGEITNYFPPDQSTNASYILNITQDTSGTLWLGTFQGGILSFNKDTEMFSQFKSEKYNSKTIGGNHIKKVYLDKSSRLWVGCWTGGLFLFHPNDTSFERFGFDDNTQAGQINDILEDSNGDFWVATENGLYILNRETKEFKLFQLEPQLNNSVTISLFEDNDKGIWIGTLTDGVRYFNIRQKNILNFQSKSRSGPLTRNEIDEIYEDSLGNALLLTDRTIDYWNRLNNQFTNLPFQDILLKDSEHRYWIKTLTGIKVTQPHNLYTYYRFFSYAQLGCDGENIIDLIEGDRHEYFLSLTQSILKIQIPEFKVVRYQLSDFGIDMGLAKNFNIFNIYFSRSNELWVVSNFGHLFSLDFKNRTYKKYTQRQHGFSTPVNGFFEDRDSNFYLYTGRGLNLYYPERDSFINYTRKDGLFSDYITSMVQDSSGTIWLGTNYGLTALMPEDMSFYSYLEAIGFSTNRFRSGAIYTKDDMLIFSNDKGISAFKPGDIRNLQSPIPINLISFKIFNKETTACLNKHIIEADFITLNYHQSLISFEFISMNFIQPSTNKYAYKMEGLDNDWIISEKVNLATYNSLPPGKYTFRVKNIGNKIFSAPQERAINVEVLPPFWKKTYFKFVIVFIIIILYSIIYRLRAAQIEKQTLILEKQVEERTIQIRKQKEEIEEQSVLLENKNTELSKLNATKDKFFGIIAHDLRNPFQVINSIVDNLITQKKLNQSQSKDLFLIRQTSAKAAELLENLLVWSRSQTKSIQVYPVEIKLVEIIHSVCSTLKSFAESKEISLIFNIPEEIICVADKNMLQTVLRNLISNALKYTPIGGEVNVSVKTDFDHIMVLIQDSGIGFDKETAEDLFKIEKSKSRKGTNGEEGTGLGLIICKELIEQNKGEINFTSQPLKGTLCTVKLPFKSQKLDDKADNDMPIKSIAPIQPNKSVSILIVEDNEKVRAGLEQYLLNYYNVYVTNNGVEALKIIDRCEVDLVVSDWNMPQMDGVELCKAIKANNEVSHIPFILLTARNDIEDMRNGLEVGADDYIIKPFDNELLAVRIQHILDLRIKLRQAFMKELLFDPKVLANNPMDDRFLTTAVKIVEDNIDNSDFDITKFTSLLGISRTKLHLKLKALTNQSATEFVRTLRLKKAAMLLKETNLNISEIVYEVGFNERTYFSKCFNDFFGMTPSEYRKS